jgi:sugar lactone lactonase YvrE
MQWIFATLVLTTLPASAQLASSPPLPHRLVPDWAQLPKGWNFGEVASVAVDKADNVWIFTRGQHPVMQFDRNGRFLQSWGDGLFRSAHGVRVHGDGNLWLVDVKGHVVFQYTPAGRVLMVLGYRQGFPGDNNSKDYFNEPTGIAFAANGDMFVADGYVNSRVVKYDKEGRYLMHWGTRGSGDGEFHLAHDVVIDRRGRVIVADRTNGRIQLFDQSGKFLTKWSGFGRPYGLAYSEQEDSLYVCDGEAGRIVRLNSEGQVTGVLDAPGKLPGRITAAHHLAVDSRGDLYTAEVRNWRVQKFAK